MTGQWPCAIISLSALRVKVHVYGDSTRHFKTLHDQIGAYEFDTGSSVDFGGLRQQLGPGVTLWGGPDIMVLKDGAPEQVRTETERILHSGVCDGERFILTEGNNLSPHTPVRNLAAMCEATRAYTGLSRS